MRHSRLHLTVIGAMAATLVVASCATGDHTATHYTDPMTCEVKNPQPGQDKYDAQCILAAKSAAEAAARDAARAAAAAKKK